MLRNNWTFDYAPAEVLVLAQQRVAYHGGRLAYWEAEMETREQKLRTEGIQLRTSARVQPSHMNTGYRQEIEFDASLMKDFKEAEAKVLEHRAMFTDYSRWAQALERRVNGAPNVMLQLHIDDLEYFGLVG